MPEYRRSELTTWGVLVAVALGGTFAVVVGGGILLGAIRLYVHWSVSDTVQKIQERR
jgi:hypothetical protein